MVQPKYSPEEALERVKLMMKYDLSKTSVENKKVVSEQTQSSAPDPLLCIKNYFRTKTYFYYKGAKFNKNSITGISEMEVTLNSKLIWKFFSANNGNRTWKQFSEGTLTDEGSCREILLSINLWGLLLTSSTSLADTIHHGVQTVCTGIRRAVT